MQNRFEKLIGWFDNKNMDLKKSDLILIYQASKHGFKATQFHSLCDNQGPTICIVQAENARTFGGYTNLSWNSNGNYIQGEGKSFLFSFDENTKHECLKKENE